MNVDLALEFPIALPSTNQLAEATPFIPLRLINVNGIGDEVVPGVGLNASNVDGCKSAGDKLAQLSSANMRARNEWPMKWECNDAIEPPD